MHRTRSVRRSVPLLRGVPSFARKFNHGRAKRPHVVALLTAECIRSDKCDGVAHCGTHEREGCSRAFTGVLNDRSPRRQSSGRHRAVGNGKCHSVFHAPCRVVALKLDEYTSAPIGNSRRSSTRAVPPTEVRMLGLTIMCAVTFRFAA